MVALLLNVVLFAQFKNSITNPNSIINIKDVITFSEGVCGTNYDYLFYVKTGKVETYCSKFQKPSY